MVNPNLGQFGHQFDQPSRKLDKCLSALNEAYDAVKDLDNPYLKQLINQAMDAASIEAVAADEHYRNYE